MARPVINMPVQTIDDSPDVINAEPVTIASPAPSLTERINYYNPYQRVANAITGKTPAPPADPYTVQGTPPDEGMPGDDRKFLDEGQSEDEYLKALSQLTRGRSGQAGPPGSYYGGHGLFIAGGYPAFQALADSYKQMQGGNQAAAQAASEQARQEAEFRKAEADRQYIAMIQEQAARAKEQAELQARIKAITDESNAISKVKIDQGRAFRSPAGILGAIAAGFMSLAGDPYAGIRLVNQAVDRDINIQQADLANRKAGLETQRGLLADYINLVKDDQVGRQLAEAKMKEIAANKILEVAARYRAPQIMAEAQVKAGIIKHDAVVTTMDALSKLYRDPKLMSPQLIDFYTKMGGFTNEGTNVQHQSELFNGAGPAQINVPGINENQTQASSAIGGVIGGIPGSIAAENSSQYPEDRQVPVVQKSPAMKAIEKVAVQKSPALKYIYNDKTLAGTIENLRNVYWNMMMDEAGGNPVKAQQLWVKKVGKEAADDYPKVAAAMGGFVETTNLLQRARVTMRLFRQRFGARANDVWGTLRRMGYTQGAHNLEKVQLALGLTDKEDVRILHALDTDMAAIKYAKAHGFLGTLSKNDQHIAEMMSGFDGDIDTAAKTMDRMSADISSKQKNALDHAPDIARALWRAKHPYDITPPQAVKGVRSGR